MTADITFPTRDRRFTFRKSVDATFRGVSLKVVDLSETGARVMHRDPLIVGLEGTFALQVPSSRECVALRARVIWSHALRDGKLETGLKIVDGRLDRAADLLDHLVRLGWTGANKLRAAGNKLRGSEGDLRAAHAALDFLTKNRSASARWKRLVERDFPSSHGYPTEVVAAWELLGRSIDVELVAQAHRESKPFILEGESLLVDEETGFALVDA
jgi:hypothetical protein